MRLPFYSKNVSGKVCVSTYFRLLFDGLGKQLAVEGSHCCFFINVSNNSGFFHDRNVPYIYYSLFYQNINLLPLPVILFTNLKNVDLTVSRLLKTISSLFYDGKETELPSSTLRVT